MKITKISELVGTSRQVFCPKGGFISHRILLESDNMGFSMTKTHIPKNGPQFWHYKNHLEACYCIDGVGVIKNITTGEEFKIESDTTYILDKNDPHVFEALNDEGVNLICVFNPPLKGAEVHKEDGSY